MDQPTDRQSGVQSRCTRLKVFKRHLRIIQTAWNEKNFCNGILRQRTLSEHVFKIFGPYQNHKNQTLILPYLLGKSRFGNNVFTKRNFILLLYMYQVFKFLLGPLHFFVHFFFTFMENLFLVHPIPFRPIVHSWCFQGSPITEFFLDFHEIKVIIITRIC